MSVVTVTYLHRVDVEEEKCLVSWRAGRTGHLQPRRRFQNQIAKFSVIWLECTSQLAATRLFLCLSSCVCLGICQTAQRGHQKHIGNPASLYLTRLLITASATVHRAPPPLSTSPLPSIDHASERSKLSQCFSSPPTTLMIPRCAAWLWER